MSDKDSRSSIDCKVNGEDLSSSKHIECPYTPDRAVTHIASTPMSEFRTSAASIQTPSVLFTPNNLMCVSPSSEWLSFQNSDSYFDMSPLTGVSPRPFPMTAKHGNVTGEDDGIFKPTHTSQSEEYRGKDSFSSRGSLSLEGLRGGGLPPAVSRPDSQEKQSSPRIKNLFKNTSDGNKSTIDKKRRRARDYCSPGGQQSPGGIEALTAAARDLSDDELFKPTKAAKKSSKGGKKAGSNLTVQQEPSSPVNRNNTDVNVKAMEGLSIPLVVKQIDQNNSGDSANASKSRSIVSVHSKSIPAVDQVIGSPQMQTGGDHPSISPDVKITTCNCKKSRCLKLYCDCFRAQQYCQGCHCKNCANLESCESERIAARNSIIDRNPDAFKPRISRYVENAILKVDNQTAVGPRVLGQHQSGCHCKKSACLKKYCECFQAGVPCLERCRCVDCKNTADNNSLGYQHPVGTGKGSQFKVPPHSSGIQTVVDQRSEKALDIVDKNSGPQHSRSLSAASPTSTADDGDDSKPIYNKLETQAAAYEIVNAFLRGQFTVPGLEPIKTQVPGASVPQIILPKSESKSSDHVQQLIPGIKSSLQACFKKSDGELLSESKSLSSVPQVHFTGVTTDSHRSDILLKPK